MSNLLRKWLGLVLLLCLVVPCFSQTVTPAPTPAPTVAVVSISTDLSKQSDPVLVAEITQVATQYKLIGSEILTPVTLVSTTWSPIPYFVSGLVRIPNWFGGRTILAAEFFASPTNNVARRMARYQNELKPPLDE